MKTVVVVLCVALSGSQLLGQQRTVPPKPVSLPDNMDCEKLRADKEIPSNSSATVIRRGTDYYLCRPKPDFLLKNLPTTATVAVVVRSTQTISCGDGSSGDCIREDTVTESKVRQLADATDLWRYFNQATPSQADLILQFIANEQASSSRSISLQVQNSNSGAWLYTEYRPVTDIENDVNKLITHFIAKCDRTPLRSTADIEQQKRCAATADALNQLTVQYTAKRSDYDFKTSHILDAQMEECEQHWKDYVCLGHDNPMYASNWNQSGAELKRKLQLEYEELKNLEQQIQSLRQTACQ